LTELLVTQPHTFSVRAAPVNSVTIRPGGPTVLIVPTPGVPGPAGPAGDGGITHTQSSAAATWTITHGLGRKPASVTVWLDDELVDTDIETPDTATVVITFAFPQSGRAEII
jgi:hypothetical protein